jgi:hypothetical protein
MERDRKYWLGSGFLGVAVEDRGYLGLKAWEKREFRLIPVSSKKE